MYNFSPLAVISTAATLLMVGVGMIVALLPQRILTLSGSLQDVGYLASFFAFSYLVVQIPIGRLADKFGSKSFLILGYCICCFSGISFAAARTPEGFFFGRFLQGAGEAPIWALGPALLSLAYPHAKGKVIGIYNACIHAGLTIGPLLGLLPFGNSTSQLPFLLFALACFGGGLAVFLFLPKNSPSPIIIVSEASDFKALAGLVSSREPLLTLSSILLYGACYGIFISVLPASLSLSKNFDSFDNVVFFALFYIAISISQLVVGPLSDRYSRYLFMIMGLALAAVGIVIFDLFVLPWIYVPLTIASIGLGVFCVSSIAYLNECVPDGLKATISSAYYLAWGLGYFLGPMLVGWVGELGSQRIAFQTLAALILIQTLSLWVLKTRKI